MLNAGQLQQLIQKIRDSELSGPELNVFIRTCAALSSAYLMTRRAAGKLESEYLGANDQKIFQLALNSIAELFERDDSGKLVKLIQYYEPLLSVIYTREDEALFMTRRLIVAHTKQSLIKSMVQTDPIGYKLYRNLTLVPKRDPAVILKKYGDEDYLYFSEPHQSLFFPDDFRPGLPEIDWEQASILLSTAISEQTSIPAITRLFLQKLAQDQESRAFISRMTFFRILKTLTCMPVVSLDNLGGELPGNDGKHLGVTEEDQVRYLNLAQEIILSEIKSRYIEKSRITSTDADVYFIILNLYLTDLFQDGVAGKLPEYRALSPFSDLADGLWKIHRGRLEYLIKLVKEKMKTQYSREFLSTEQVSIGVYDG